MVVFRDISERLNTEAKLTQALNELQNLKSRLEQQNEYLQEEILQEIVGPVLDQWYEQHPDQARIASFAPVKETTPESAAALGHSDLDLRVQLLQTNDHINLSVLVTTQSVTVS